MKTVLITGASSGIGYQLAKDYAQDGWNVIACGRNSAKLESLSGVHGNICVLMFDATDKAQTLEALSCLADIDLIILNAGTCEYIDKGRIDVDLFKRVFDINLFGLLNCIEALQDSFTHKTHLALMGSTAAYLGLPRAEAYGASKAAVAYLAKSLAVDLERKGVFVSLISPGFVKTPLTDKNDFAMPMLISPEQASLEIRQGLAKRKSEVHFPRKFSYFLKMLSTLPSSMQIALVKKMTRKTQ
ncbi:SDR family NAD(P)-dependent oxidoreductase [Enterovibrio sp. ZSDZ35]|uniref:SDR family NAD(P)-dependent oxidoreductase n=1 Tax=Enterovibrio qingdaonensis TaxID=2899818 RepID=A0ABT5QG72_9GAMM|nr:SDR family NAD(P)-dependent oxidoreductase [Enterovibrio sp. ZSDZ35]MDD1779639.1 SDR family NAD(P)-dependent oxidoreductase [Enterovibrio sp. ZSDZ35]